MRCTYCAVSSCDIVMVNIILRSQSSARPPSMKIALEKIIPIVPVNAGTRRSDDTKMLTYVHFPRDPITSSNPLEIRNFCPRYWLTRYCYQHQTFHIDTLVVLLICCCSYYSCNDYDYFTHIPVTVSAVGADAATTDNTTSTTTTNNENLYSLLTVKANRS